MGVTIRRIYRPRPHHSTVPEFRKALEGRRAQLEPRGPVVTEGELLFRAVLLNPYEDAPRLVYADWLDENASSDLDRERAQLIRLAIAARRNVPEITHPGRRLARDGLVFRLIMKVCGSEPTEVKRLLGRCVWDRGYVSQVCVTVTELTEVAPVLFARHPIVGVSVIGRSARVDLSTVGFAWLPSADAAENERFGMSESLNCPSVWTEGTAPHVLPFALYDLTERGRDQNVAPDNHTANEWLDRAAVRYGRIKAGLED